VVAAAARVADAVPAHVVAVGDPGMGLPAGVLVVCTAAAVAAAGVVVAAAAAGAVMVMAVLAGAAGAAAAPMVYVTEIAVKVAPAGTAADGTNAAAVAGNASTFFTELIY